MNKKIIDYREILNSYEEVGLKETAEELAKDLGIIEDNKKYVWYISLPDVERDTLRDRLEDNKGLEQVLSEVKREMKDKGVTTYYSLADYSIQFGSVYLGSGQKIELRDKEGLIKITSYKVGIENLLDTFVRVMWRLRIK